MDEKIIMALIEASIEERKHLKKRCQTALSKTNEWQKCIENVSEEIQQEYDRLSFCPPQEANRIVIYAEYLISAVNFLKRAGEMLDEHKEALERERVWSEAKLKSQEFSNSSIIE